MYKHIGVGLDGSAYGATAEQLALELAGHLGAAVHGIHVVDASFIEGAFITDISGAMGFEPFLNLQAQMRDTLDDLADVIRARFSERCEAAGIECRFHLKHASAVHGLLEAAKLVDLLVVGQRGVNAQFHEDLLGPTTEVLLRRSPVPLLVVPERSKLPVQPLAAYDGSVKACRALHWAAELCRQMSLPLTVVTVDERDDRAQQRLQEAVSYLSTYDITPATRHERGEAVEEILLQLLGDGGYDLLFLGAHGHRRIVELVTGSTTEFLARRSPVPVLCATQT